MTRKTKGLRKFRNLQYIFPRFHSNYMFAYDIISLIWESYLWFKSDRRTTYPKLNSTGVWTHDLQMVDSAFHVPEMPVLTTEPSGTSSHMCRSFKGYSLPEQFAHNNTRAKWTILTISWLIQMTPPLYRMFILTLYTKGIDMTSQT